MAMSTAWLGFYSQPLSDGVEFLPKTPGIYALYDRVHRKFYVGAAEDSMYKRACDHRRALRQRRHPNRLLNQMLQGDGEVDCFFFVLQEVPLEGPRTWAWKTALWRLELWWAINLRAVDEEGGYNQEAGHVRTPSWRLRDQMNFLCRSGQLSLLGHVPDELPIRPSLAHSWTRGLKGLLR